MICLDTVSLGFTEEKTSSLEEASFRGLRYMSPTRACAAAAALCRQLQGEKAVDESLLKGSQGLPPLAATSSAHEHCTNKSGSSKSCGLQASSCTSAKPLWLLTRACLVTATVRGCDPASPWVSRGRPGWAQAQPRLWTQLQGLDRQGFSTLS